MIVPKEVMIKIPIKLKMNEYRINLCVLIFDIPKIAAPSSSGRGDAIMNPAMIGTNFAMNPFGLILKLNFFPRISLDVSSSSLTNLSLTKRKIR